MLGSEALADIQLNLQHVGVAGDIENALKAVQQRFERLGLRSGQIGVFRPWFLVVGPQALVTVEDEITVSLPDDFLAETEDDALWLYTATAEVDEQWQPLAKDSLDFLRADHPGVGSPKAYSVLGLSLYLFPVPDDIYMLRMSYYAADAAFALTEENKWMKYAPDVLIGEAGRRVAMALRDQSAVQIFTDRFQQAVMDLWATTEERLHVNRRYVIGGLD